MSHISTGIARVMFTVNRQTMVLLHGFQKKSRRTPQADLLTAKRVTAHQIATKMKRRRLKVELR